MKAYVFLALLSTAYAAADFKLQCAEKADRGPCELDLPRWWYNMDAARCEVFNYGGCGGNANLYKTKQHCEETCMDKKPSPTADAPVEGVTREIEMGHIESMCRLPPHRGPCMGNLQRFYFDHEKQKCRPFVFGGCQSNGNNFETYVNCMSVCKGSLSP
ncbi:hypothetical protein HPB49_011981 [Dermacentor silvarum]|uniref:Uncharacterized protein n=1 Tax=Dermacentor silvarum TaxID=543639 RepID=A0ACB8CF29_DERSI|nr:boophilin-H2 [Dermacentor silvarum]KAH7941306.1 hypothetical protein HPB49_011981 [Dermacentor silvarum]